MLITPQYPHLPRPRPKPSITQSSPTEHSRLDHALSSKHDARVNRLQRTNNIPKGQIGRKGNKSSFVEGVLGEEHSADRDVFDDCDECDEI